MVTVVVVEFGVMRCQPLRRALADFQHHKKRICA
ncbi:acetyltransferase [Vibrio cholerae]|nr:acetyltransferase [Vibrio cholerae]